MEVANLYDNGPISPIAQIKEHLAIWSDQKWMPYQIEFIEGLPHSGILLVDLVAISGALIIAANATITGQLLPALSVNEHQLIHMRFYVLDDIEVQMWQLSNMARLASRGGHAGVNLMTPMYDPNLAGSTFWVLGGIGAKDARFGCTNLTGAALPMARVAYFGYLYHLTLEDRVHPNARYIPAQGRS